ncbi:hypothetical protein ACHAXS_007186 [Conticribra weissflogii]
MIPTRSSFHIHLDQSHKTALSDISFGSDLEDRNRDINCIADSLLERIGEFRREASCPVDDNKTIDPPETDDRSPIVKSTNHKHEDDHVQAIIELKLRVANQQALIDELYSKLSEAESEKRALRIGLKLENDSMIGRYREDGSVLRLQAENQQLRAKVDTLERTMKTQIEECERKIEYYKNENMKLKDEKKLWEGGENREADANEVSSSQVRRAGLMKLILRQESGCSASEADKPKVTGGNNSRLVNSNFSSELQNGARLRERATRRASIADTPQRPHPLQTIQSVAMSDESIIDRGINLIRASSGENRRISQRPGQNNLSNNVSQALEMQSMSSSVEEDAGGLLVSWGDKVGNEENLSKRRTRRMSNYF